jgi:hypothetical protein
MTWYTLTSSKFGAGPGTGVRDVVINHNLLMDDVHALAVPVLAETTAVGNLGSGEDNLMSTTLAAGLIATSGGLVHVRAWGTTANNANAKTLKLYFGTAVIASVSLTANAAYAWNLDAVVLRTGTDTQDYTVLIHESTGTLGAAKQAQVVGTATEDDGATITVKCTGEATADSDIVQEGMIVRVVTGFTASKIGDGTGPY